MTDPKTVTVQERLLPCRECGADCSVQEFRGPHVEGVATIWICSEHRYLGGKCPSDTAYLTSDAWNDLTQLNGGRNVG